MREEGADDPADLIEFLAFMHPDAEYQPFHDAPVYHGLTEIREWAVQEAADPAPTRGGRARDRRLGGGLQLLLGLPRPRRLALS